MWIDEELCGRVKNVIFELNQRNDSLEGKMSKMEEKLLKLEQKLSEKEENKDDEEAKASSTKTFMYCYNMFNCCHCNDMC